MKTFRLSDQCTTNDVEILELIIELIECWIGESISNKPTISKLLKTVQVTNYVPYEEIPEKTLDDLQEISMTLKKEKVLFAKDIISSTISSDIKLASDIWRILGAEKITYMKDGKKKTVLLASYHLNLISNAAIASKQLRIKAMKALTKLQRKCASEDALIIKNVVSKKITT